MKTVLAMTAAVLVGVGHLMSQPVAQLETPYGQPLKEFFRDQVPAQNAHIKMPAGVYKVTPSILNSNLLAGNQFQGVTIANRTNLVIEGVPGQTIWDGSSALGELLWLSNVSHVTIRGVTFRGYTNHNFTLLPRWGSSYLTNCYLWAGVNYYMADNLTFENCTVERHADHGIQDKGAEGNQAGLALATSVISTNNIKFLNCTFRDIGGWRTNYTLDGTIAKDGTAIVMTGGWVENCYFDNVFRGIEPYNEGDSNAVVFSNCQIVNNRFRNVVEFGVGFAGSTNGHNVQIIGNRVENDLVFSYHGTNFGTSLVPAPTVGFYLNGGRGHYLANNEAVGGIYQGFYLVNSASFLDDTTLLNNTARGLDRGDGAGIGFWFGDTANTAAAASSVRRLTVRGNRAIRTATVGFLVSAGRDVLMENNETIGGTLYTSVNVAYAGYRIGTAGNSSAQLTNIVLRNNVAHDAGIGAAFGYVWQNNIQSAVNDNNTAISFAANGGVTNLSGSAVYTIGAPRYFSGTINLPSIGTAAQFTTNITASGVTTNDQVTLQYPSDFYASGNTSNLVLSAWATNGAVYIKASNVDAVTAADAPATRFTAIVRQVAIHGQ